MDDWRLFTNPRFALRFRYPSLTAGGEPVDQLETQQKDMLRVHVLAATSRLVYFEVRKYARLTPFVAYQRHKESLFTRFDSLVISELRTAQCASLAAYEYTFEWEHGRRVALLVRRAGALYRIIYDPGSAVNLQILSSLEWLDLI